MDERDRERQSIGARPEGTGRLRAGVERAHAGVKRLRGDGGRMRDAGDRVRGAGEDAAWFLRERVVWPAQDGLDALGPRGQIGVFGGGGIAVAGIVAALLIAGGGSGSASGGTTEAFVVPERGPAPTAVAPTAKPKRQKAAKPTGPTLHGAAPDFSPAQDVKAGVGGGKAVGKESADGATGGVAAERGAGDSKGEATGSSATTGAGDTPASSAKIGATPAASASATAQAESLSKDSASGGAQGTIGVTGKGAGGEDETGLNGPPAPKAAKRVARHFAEAFVVYETGGVDAKVRNSFRRTTTKQLSKALLERPPRQPAAVKVPRAKVVTVVAGPSKGSVYEVSVSLLRVGVTSELRLAMEQGPGKKWQVTNVLG